MIRTNLQFDKMDRPNYAKLTVKYLIIPKEVIVQCLRPAIDIKLHSYNFGQCVNEYAELGSINFMANSMCAGSTSLLINLEV